MFWYNGKLVDAESLDLAITEPGLLYGATVFTTLRIYEQNLDHPLTHWQQHCDRVRSTLDLFQWQSPDWKRIRHGAETLMQSYSVLRITIFPNGREWIMGRELPDNLPSMQSDGVTAWVANSPEFQRTLAHCKTGNYLGAWLALQKAKELSSQEAILVNPRGNWLETSTGNLWGWYQGCWWTPPLNSGILPGIARSQLCSWLQQNGNLVAEAVWDDTLVQKLDAIAYSNSVMEIVPIHTVSIESTSLTYDPKHPVLQQLRSYYGS